MTCTGRPHQTNKVLVMWLFQSSSNFLSCYCVSKNTKGRDEATLFSWLNQCNNHVGNSTAKFRGSALPCYTIQINLITYIFWRGRVGAGLRTGFNCQFQIMKILSEIFLLTQNRGSIPVSLLTLFSVCYVLTSILRLLLSLSFTYSLQMQFLYVSSNLFSLILPEH